jgi:hypothetical protein
MELALFLLPVDSEDFTKIMLCFIRQSEDISCSGKKLVVRLAK